ncbi:hypothetical protein ACFV80_20860 [Streptomyces sp. NPDC059862]|uniref:hypothetical protein n=1 Tax=Streptomyces sp. NPDC059862 TaxID=3346975 RepID=UPI00364A498E
MSESTPGSEVPDFLDRLIARHAPVSTGPRPDVVRVRPRLPGPFERIEAVRARNAGEDAEPVWPSSTPSAAPRPDTPRAAPAARAARLHTERERTVVRTERPLADPAQPPAPPAVAEALLLRPVAPVVPGPRPVPDAGRRTPGRPERAVPTAASVPIPPGTDAASPAAPAAPRPRAADTAAAREAVRQAAARRSARAPEQVVQVQIGRLEVTAAPSPSGGPRQRTPGTERPGATVSLAEYLARGRE